MNDDISLVLPSRLLDTIAQRAARILQGQLQPARPVTQWLDVGGAAAHLCCPKSRIYRLVSMRRIPHHKDGARLLFDTAELDAWVRQGGAR